MSLCLLYFSSVSSCAGLQTAPEGSFASADALLSRLAHPASLCGALDYLEPDLAEKNPPVFAQKLQVCSSRVTFWEFVKTSVENELRTPNAMRQDLMRRCWKCSRWNLFPLKDWCVDVLAPRCQNDINRVITYGTNHLYFNWEIGPKPSFFRSFDSPKSSFCDLFTEPRVLDHLEAKLFIDTQAGRLSQTPIEITSGLGLTKTISYSVP